MKFHKTALFAMLLATLFGGYLHLAWADGEDDEDNMQMMTGTKPGDFIKSRTYIGIVGISADIDQSQGFNGGGGYETLPVTVQTTPTTLWSFEEVDLVPAINRNFGFGVILGHREGPWAGEVSFWQSYHNAFWNGGGPTNFTSTSLYDSINIDLKRYFFTNIPTQPFLDIGMSFPWLTTKQASFQFDPNNGFDLVSVDDSTVSGIGLNLGAGLEIYMGDGFSLVGAAIERWTSFDQVNGAGKQDNDHIYFNNNSTTYGNFEGNGLNFYAGTTFGFE